MHVTIGRDGSHERTELDLGYFDSLALQAALGLAQVPPPPVRPPVAGPVRGDS